MDHNSQTCKSWAETCLSPGSVQLQETTFTGARPFVPCAGTFVFCMRSISDDLELGPWSQESAPICVTD